ncbi:Membrane-associated guanylate kinase, WW and PDZ domain-containing protein 2 [Lamellibrachia satsuma]|nr:Membrane-associated guanylate kinase, WW and PDZ domain-containing protein 2 [Lamellibrachia satsuma]
MLKPKQPPKSPSPTKNKREPRHWNERVHECILSAGPEGLFPMVIKGGAENGQFCYIGEIKQEHMNYHSGKLHHDEILLEIQGQKVSGFTLRDLLEWLKHVSKNSAPVMFKTIKAGECP